MKVSVQVKKINQNNQNQSTMKKLILITLLALATALAHAQEKKAIEIKKIERQGQSSEGNAVSANGTHEFAIHANEDAYVDLTIFLKTDGDLNVIVKSKDKKVLHSKKFTKKDANKLRFTIDQNEEYTVTLTSAANTKFTISAEETL